jgi:GntR family transcriptional regulator
MAYLPNAFSGGSFSMQSYLHPRQWFDAGNGPRYRQLYRHLQHAITEGAVAPGSKLPPEREIAEYASVSRVTVRNAISRLIDAGLVEQVRGSGSYVTYKAEEGKVEYGLSSLTSFTEYMEQRGLHSTSVVLDQGIVSPRPEEMLALGLSPQQKIARIKRLRSADNTPMAIETSSVPADVLSRPDKVDVSLYHVLRQTGFAPVRAIQTIKATNLSLSDTRLLELPVGTAVLSIDRTGYLESGRPIELTQGIYRSDVYEFVAELNLGD